MIDKHIEITYVNRLGVYLPNFKQTKARTWAFSHSCETAKPGKRLKARGSIYEITNNAPFNVKCFHCGYSVKFTTLLKEISPSLYDEYRLHEYREHGIEEKPLTDSLTKPAVADAALKAVFKDRPDYFCDESLSGLIKVNTISPSSPVIRWLERRAIPRKKYKLLYVAKNFYKWASEFNPDFKDNRDNSPRLVLPYFDNHGRVLGFTARTFSPNVEPRYIHIRIDKTVDFVYGSDRIDPSKRIYVTEGQIDSLFIDNCVAVGSANYMTDFMLSIKTNCTIIPDSDWKRNPQVAKQLLKAINEGFSVCLLPDTMKGKDINDYVKNGVHIDELKEIIDKYTFVGLKAKLEFTVNKKF